MSDKVTIDEGLVRSARFSTETGVKLPSKRVRFAMARAQRLAAEALDRRRQLPLPGIYDAEKVGELFAPDYPAILSAASAFRAEHGILPRRLIAPQQRVSFTAIDQQLTFCWVNGELSMAPAAVLDTQRICEFVYRNAHVITDKEVTLDSHGLWHIFHPVFWLDAQGNFVAPYTAIMPDDVGSKFFVNPEMCGIIFPNLRNPMSKLSWLQDYAKAYCTKLIADGKAPLVVWPIHGRLGHVGHGLMPALATAVDFHDVLRYTETSYRQKGGRKLVEFYSPYGSEVVDLQVGEKLVRVGAQAQRAAKRLLRYRVSIFAGEARSHCVRAALLDVLAAAKATDPSLASRVYILKDCTSNVPGFEKQGDDALAFFADNGMNVVDSSTPMSEWPGMPEDIIAKAA